ncbi:heterokaryon incompatibility protein-domain-containing protein [Alternaria rosae]|uniref:heterokaryon incompatibility protein-domain-containing protein n=1 Tax=Alternaria rosae TaxID=1187941 RepID=UPI001E8ECF94|nr:heterokaryon incompatibility protein-domain-containing protein [Alternaria rosae]KAH6865287.1 heterokaryon incompatibility protein-domain-containing protein [Alternaria rosae]
MDKKHQRSDDNGIWSCHDQLRPLKHVKHEHFGVENLTNSSKISDLELHNRPIVDRGLIYSKRLEASTVRILVLHHGSPSDEIKCDLKQEEDLVQTSLVEVSRYEALSYVWGEEENPDYIVLGESRFAVTRNLSEALRYLRYPDSDRMLWVDAICINQYDIEEKEAQVTSMHCIYKSAKQVIAWLGPPDNASSHAFSAMRALQKQNKKAVSATITIQLDKDGASNEDNPFRELMARPYWSRAWIVQEMMFARSLVVQCGTEVVPYSALIEAHPSTKPACIQIGGNESGPGRINFQGDPEVKIPRIGTQQISANRFLDCFLDRQCSKRHDSIFAFLNLLSDDIKREVRVCYKTDISELVRNTAQAIIRSTQSLHIIVIRGRQTPPSAREQEWQLHMPYWCPYLATPYEACPIEPRNKPTFFLKKDVCSFVNSRLRVRGSVIGRVARTISRYIPPETPVTGWWDKAGVERELKHYGKCLGLGLIGIPNDKQMISMSFKATTRTLLAGQGDISDVGILLSGQEPAELPLREIWNYGAYRSVCSFQISRTAIEALYSSKSTPSASVNRVALIPRNARRGDVICAILGCATPVVLRKVGKRYHVLGEAYIDTTAMGKFRVAIRLRDFILE